MYIKFWCAVYITCHNSMFMSASPSRPASSSMSATMSVSMSTSSTSASPSPMNSSGPITRSQPDNSSMSLPDGWSHRTSNSPHTTKGYTDTPDQATRLRFQKGNTWVATFGQPRTPGCKQNVSVSNEWVNANFDTRFIAKCQRNTGKLLQIRAGKASHNNRAEVSNLPKIHWQQRNEDTCIMHSLASAMFSMKATDKNANPVHNIIADLSKYPSYSLKNLKDFLPRVGWLTIDIDTTDLLSNRSEMPRVVQLHSSSGSISHVVTLLGDYIFDSNKTHALTLTQAGLDNACLGKDTFRDFICAFELMPCARVKKHMGLWIPKRKWSHVEAKLQYKRCKSAWL